MAEPSPPPHEAETRPPDVESAPQRPGRWRSVDASRIVLLAMTGVLVYGAIRTLWAFVTAIILGAWAAHIARPLFRRLDRMFRGRQKAAATLTAALVVLIATPVAITIATLVPAARSLVEQLRTSGGGRNALEALVSNGGGDQGAGVTELIRNHGESASKVVAMVAGASIEAVVGVFVFLVVFYASLVGGRQMWGWLEKNAPLDPSALHRMGAAFFQAGRGLIVGDGVTALVQGAVATIAYFALGVPRALLFGFLSSIAALIPFTGPTIVWIPIAVGLALTGHSGKAAILAAIGVFVIGTVDNLLRPWITKRAHVGLETSIVLVAMFGGIALFGGWGLLLGPLIVRLAAEALAIVRERGLLGRVNGTLGH